MINRILYNIAKDHYDNDIHLTSFKKFKEYMNNMCGFTIVTKRDYDIYVQYYFSLKENEE